MFISRSLILFFYRELSGAHIEVEKQSKGQGDRTILIKGTQLPFSCINIENIRVADPRHINADPYPAFHSNKDIRNPGKYS